MAGRVIPMPSRLVEVDILWLSECPCPGVGICQASPYPGDKDFEVVIPKLTLEMADRRKTESPYDSSSCGVGPQFESGSNPKPPSVGAWLILVQSVTVPVRHSSDVKQKIKTKY